MRQFGGDGARSAGENSLGRRSAEHQRAQVLVVCPRGHLRLGSDRPEFVNDGGGDPADSWEGSGARGGVRPEGGNRSDWTLDGAVGRQVLRVLRQTGWNKSEAARLLKISRSRLARLIEKFYLEDGDR